MKDGWHVIKGFEVYVDDNKVIRGVKKDHSGSEVPAHVYKLDEKMQCWNSVSKVNVNTFRSGKYELM